MRRSMCPRVVAERDVTARREPVELDGKRSEQDGEPELREDEADGGSWPTPFEKTVSPAGPDGPREAPRRQADEEENSVSSSDGMIRSRTAFADRASGLLRPEVALHDLLEPDRPLHRIRLVEAELLAGLNAIDKVVAAARS